MRRASPRLGLAVTSLALALVAPGAALAQAQAKSGDDWIDTDRPDTTEGPYVVKPGRPQLETTVLGWSRSGRDGAGLRTDTWEAGTTELRLGLAPRLEANLFFQPYGRVTSSGGGPVQDGPGDVTLRFKLNLWGAGGVDKLGDTALGLIPFVDIPTDRRNGVGDAGVGGGVIVPFDLSLGGPLHLGANLGALARRDDPGQGYRAVVLASASFGVDWSRRWGTSHEVASELPDRGGSRVTLDNGVAFKVTPDLQLDAGVNLGLTHAADRVTTFFGAAARF